MNTNYEAVVSLIELLVKKAGFDLSSNYSELELQKTKESIASLIKKRDTAKDKNELNSLIESLKVRQAKWENNAEMVGKSLVTAYEEGKDYGTVKMRIELLANLAQKGTDNISVGSVYDRIKSLDNEYKTLTEKIENTNYSNEAEKEMDVRYKTYLENKLTSIEIEVEALDKELESLREVELKDVGIVTKIKEYITKLKSDREKIDKAVKSSVNSDVGFEVWERLETAKNNTNDKLNHANDLLTKTEEMLENVKKNRADITERKNGLEADKTRCKTKLANVTKKLEESSYENTSLKMIDVNNSEMMKLELESLNNKKDVVYVDVGKVKEELIKAWSKDRPPITRTRKPIVEKPTLEKEIIKKEVEEKIPKPEIEEEILDKTIIMDPILEEISKEIEEVETPKEIPETSNTESIEIIEEIKEENQIEKDILPKVETTPSKEVKENHEEIIKQTQTPILESEKEVKDALDNIDELIEKSENNMKKISEAFENQLKNEKPVEKKIEETKQVTKVVENKPVQKVETVKPKVEVKEKKNKIELDW